MKIKLTYLTIAFAISIVTATLALGQNRRVVAEAERVTGDRFTMSQRTPRGTKVVSVSRPGAAMLAAIDFTTV